MMDKSVTSVAGVGKVSHFAHAPAPALISILPAKSERFSSSAESTQKRWYCADGQPLVVTAYERAGTLPRTRNGAKSNPVPAPLPAAPRVHAAGSEYLRNRPPLDDAALHDHYTVTDPRRDAQIMGDEHQGQMQALLISNSARIAPAPKRPAPIPPRPRSALRVQRPRRGRRCARWPPENSCDSGAAPECSVTNPISSAVHAARRFCWRRS